MSRFNHVHSLSLALMALVLSSSVTTLQAQTTAFSYQGRLTDGGVPAAGVYDLQFKLFDAVTGGVQQGGTLALDDVQVTGGTFSVTLNFGATTFPGANRWLEIGVRPGASAEPFIVLGPLQAISSTPYAIRSLSAGAADVLSAACVNCVTSSQIGALPADSGNYIQNTSSQQANANFSISGNGLIAGNVGIGTTSPTAKLDVIGNLKISGNISVGTGNPNNNSGIGASVLSNNTTGTNNTGTGASALSSNTSGAYNTASGFQALSGNTSGGSNTATGIQTLLLNTIGFGNTATGDSALRANISGNFNTATGLGALNNNTTSGGNTATGAYSLALNTTGTEDTATGNNALFSNTTGNGNTATGANSLNQNSNGGANTATGNNAMRNNTTGGGNTATGADALRSNTTGINNTATGNESLFTNTSVGGDNTATGSRALRGNTTGGNNTATGAFALLSNTIGIHNTASGHSSLHDNISGNENTATGNNALFGNTTGHGNTAIGSSAGYTSIPANANTTGSNNTYIGFNAGPGTSAQLVNSTAIGAFARVDASNKIRLGDSAVTVLEAQVALTVVSDRNQKENFQPVSAEEVLKKVANIEVPSWNYIGHDAEEFRHYGPMAQDFFAAFGRDGVGKVGSPTTINSADLSAILMLAVQALEKRTSDLNNDNEALKTQNASFAKEIRDLRSTVEELAGRAGAKLRSRIRAGGPRSGAGNVAGGKREARNPR